MLRLGRRSRTALAGAGLTAFALAYATTPLVAQGDRPPLVGDLPAARAAAPALVPPPAVVPRRDPFAGPPEPSASGIPGPNAPAPTIPTLPPLPALPAALGVLPPNVGAAGMPVPTNDAGAARPPANGIGSASIPPDGARVTAVITGAHARAIVAEPNGTRVVAVGDLVADVRVTAIDTAGVHLANGTTLAVAPAAAPVSPVAPVVPLPPFPSPPVLLHVPPVPPRMLPAPLPAGGPLP